MILTQDPPITFLSVSSSSSLSGQPQQPTSQPSTYSLTWLWPGPIHSPHRRAILQFLHECPNPCHINDILAATCYDYEPGRKMLKRMQYAGELISLDRDLYTTAHHPCLANFTSESPQPTPKNVPDVPNSSPISVEVNYSASRWSKTLKELPIYRPQAWAEALAELHAHVRTSTHQELSFLRPMSHVPASQSISSLISRPFDLPQSGQTYFHLNRPPQFLLNLSQSSLKSTPFT